MFTNHLTDADIQLLTDAAVAGDVFEFPRALWFEGVRRGFVATLQIAPSPLVQFRLDLAKLNAVERLEDGSIPLRQFLANIAKLLRTANRQEATVFDRLANRSGNAAEGVKPAANVSQLPEVVRKEAIVHQDDMVAIGFLASAMTVGKSVGRITVPRFENGQQRMIGANRPWIMNGTGWLIGNDLFITNHHVVNARIDGEAAANTADLQRQAVGATISFDFDTDNSAPVNAEVTKLELADEALDYAILRLRSAPANRKPLSLAAQLLVKNDRYVPAREHHSASGRVAQTHRLPKQPVERRRYRHHPLLHGH